MQIHVKTHAGENVVQLVQTHVREVVLEHVRDVQQHVQIAVVIAVLKHVRDVQLIVLGVHHVREVVQVDAVMAVQGPAKHSVMDVQLVLEHVRMHVRGSVQEHVVVAMVAVVVHHVVVVLVAQIHVIQRVTDVLGVQVLVVKLVQVDVLEAVIHVQVPVLDAKGAQVLAQHIVQVHVKGHVRDAHLVLDVHHVQTSVVDVHHVVVLVHKAV